MPIYSDGTVFRPVTPAEVADVVRQVGDERAVDRPFEVVVWAVAPDSTRRRDYERAGATWLIEGPAPGPDWLDDAMAIAGTAPALSLLSTDPGR